MSIAYKDLLAEARAARKNAYAPYSGFAVGAALLCRDGRIYRGCNVENASFSPTCCAERTAVFSAVCDGARDFAAIAVIGGPKDGDGGFCAPCGVCRQVLSEFCAPDCAVVLEGEDGEPTVMTVAALLPARFGGEVQGKKDLT